MYRKADRKMGNEKEIVLVTAIGTMTATTVVDELRKAGRYYIIGGDIYERNMVATAKDTDEFYVFPPAIYELDQYIEFVLDFCKQHRVRYYFAVIDEEIVNLSNNREKFEQIGVKLCIPNKKLVETCHFKNLFAAWVSEQMPEIAIRTFRSAEEISDADFPLFVKPVEGRASIGCRKIDNRTQLFEFVDPAEIGKTVIAQQFAEGEIATVDIIRNHQTGQIMTVPRTELLRNSNGCGIAVRTFRSEKLENICRELAEKLELNGVVILLQGRHVPDHRDQPALFRRNRIFLYGRCQYGAECDGDRGRQKLHNGCALPRQALRKALRNL